MPGERSQLRRHASAVSLSHIIRLPRRRRELHLPRLPAHRRGVGAHMQPVSFVGSSTGETETPFRDRFTVPDQLRMSLATVPHLGRMTFVGGPLGRSLERNPQAIPILEPILSPFGFYNKSYFIRGRACEGICRQTKRRGDRPLLRQGGESAARQNAVLCNSIFVYNSIRVEARTSKLT